MKKLLKGARVIDPSQNTDTTSDVLIVDGRIAAVKDEIEISDAKVIDLSGMIVTPGLIDIHVHFRDPGYEYKEDIESGSMSAAVGGFTAAACMPNTKPPIDNAALVQYVKSKASKAGKIKLLPIGCVSKGQEGKEIAEMGDMAQAGAVAFSDDGKPIADSALMRKAMVYASMFDKVIIDHCEDPFLFEGGQINEGYISTLLGLAGIPAAAEEIMVARNILIAREMGTRVHIAHVSTEGSLRLIRQAKSEGVKVSCEVTPHHLTLTEKAVMGYDTNAKVNPPLRTQSDIDALLEGLKDGTIDAIATDHAPHHMDEKDMEFDKAAFGMVGLETALGVILTHIVKEGVLSLNAAIEKMTSGPAKVLGLDMGTLKIGAPADITVIDPNRVWTVDKNKFFSKGRNTPFDGWRLTGKAVLTMVDGRIVYSDDIMHNYS
ncbi:Dihydroorotase [Tepidanaerobacter acetatoxydans Re1]|uniref:Dihydroorotase n=1 Tax=Tepidanaerobacter acetatoxydans (strain DSM 21804 / JCM 16047 / Re1) TaxID=1209989 RepID=F4LTX0_TEPAE|nr:dihydroorotase [Tepidanaerobacter acetatoxydans]AEE92567.1 dihydroorotase, multifunctional complex type [Tepidanaerobacter acetatoxydans Re1]CCP27519.1 Dihydroorotase [Tepidanaerobacter acetatoxydans Re1]